MHIADELAKLQYQVPPFPHELAVAEIEAALNDKNQTLMMVPTELVPEIVKLINKKRPA